MRLDSRSPPMVRRSQQLAWAVPMEMGYSLSEAGLADLLPDSPDFTAVPARKSVVSAAGPAADVAVCIVALSSCNLLCPKPFDIAAPLILLG